MRSGEMLCVEAVLTVRYRSRWLLLGLRQAFSLDLRLTLMFWNAGPFFDFAWLDSVVWGHQSLWYTYTRLNPFLGVLFDSTRFDLTWLNPFFNSYPGLDLTCLYLPLWYLLFLYNSFSHISLTRTRSATAPARSTSIRLSHSTQPNTRYSFFQHNIRIHIYTHISIYNTREPFLLKCHLFIILFSPLRCTFLWDDYTTRLYAHS